MIRRPTRWLPTGCVVLLLAVAVSASAGPWLPMPGEYYSEFTGSHESSNSFLDAQGNRSRLGFGTLSESRQLRFCNELGWKKAVSLVLVVPVTSVTLRSEAPFLNGTQTGLSDFQLGARLKLLGGPTALALEGDWVGPLGYDRDAVPSLGEGQQNLGGTVHFGTALERLDGFFQLAWGYVHRFEEPLDRIEHGADLGFWLWPSVLVAGHYRGSYFVGSSESGREFDSHVAGPELRCRLDDRLDVFAGSSYVVGGRSLRRSESYYLGVAVKHTRLDRLQGFLGGTLQP